MQPHAQPPMTAVGVPPPVAAGARAEQPPQLLQQRAPATAPVAVAAPFSPASSPNQPRRSGGGRSVASPTSRARVPGGHGIPLSFGRATLPIPPPSPPPDMSPQGFTAKAAQAALAAAANAANKAQERRVHQPAVGQELAMLRDAANAANIASAASVAKAEPPPIVPEPRERSSVAGGMVGGATERMEREPPHQQMQPQQQVPLQQQQQQQMDPHDRKRPIAFTPNTYKTEICRSHAATGNCEYGAYCQFAHGVAELRARDFDVKYKTKLCKNFYETGHCRFASRCKFIHDEQRVQVSETEFWLVSPSDNLVRVEVAHTPERRAQLQSLVTSTFTPPPYRVSPTHAPAQPSSAPLVSVSVPAGLMPPPFVLADPAVTPRNRNVDGSTSSTPDDATDQALHNAVAAFQNLSVSSAPTPVPASPQLQVPYFQFTVPAEPPPPSPAFPVYTAPVPAVVVPPPPMLYPPTLPYGSPLLGARVPEFSFASPHKGPAPPPPLVLAAPPFSAPPMPPMVIATQPHHLAFPAPMPAPHALPHPPAPQAMMSPLLRAGPRVSRANLTDVHALRAQPPLHLRAGAASTGSSA